MSLSDLPWNDARMFYLPLDDWHEPYILKGQEAKHAIQVLRLQRGDKIRLIDGFGREGAFVIASCSNKKLELTALKIWEHKRAENGAILALGWTKAARRSLILEKAVEFEADAIWFWQADRSQFPMPNLPGKRWHEQLITGAKQCRNPWLPELRLFSGGIESVIKASQGCTNHYALLENDYKSESQLKFEMLALKGQTIYIIGPEGGFSPKETQTLQKANFHSLSLGERVLRWESAAFLCLGLHWWKRELNKK